jgi:hypothetical protein
MRSIYVIFRGISEAWIAVLRCIYFFPSCLLNGYWSPMSKVHSRSIQFAHMIDRSGPFQLSRFLCIVTILIRSFGLDARRPKRARCLNIERSLACATTPVRDGQALLQIRLDHEGRLGGPILNDYSPKKHESWGTRRIF